ncbi:MAG: DUF3568 family protein [Planctomycetota bacterium]
MRTSLAAVALGVCLLGGTVPMVGCSSSTIAGTPVNLTPVRSSETYFPAPVREAYQASIRALEGLRYDIVSSDDDVDYGVVNAKTARNEDIKVEVRQDSANFTKVSVLIGLPGIGDDDRQLMILNHIERELGFGN